MTDGQTSEAGKSSKSTSEEEEETFRNVMTKEAAETGAVITCYVSYCFLLYNRKVFMFLLPQIITHNFYTTGEIGWITTAQTLAYMKGKTMAGPMVEQFSPRVILAASMFMSGFLMLLYSDLNNSSAVIVISVLHGFFQSLAWPAIAKVVFSWITMGYAGLYWAGMTTSVYFMGIIGPPIAMFISSRIGWEYAMVIPAMLLMFLSPVAFFFTWLPGEAGFKDREHALMPKDEADENKVHWTDIFSSDFSFVNFPVVLLLAAIKQALIEWGPAFLQANHSFTGVQTDLFVRAIEVGGVAGCLFLGAFTDKLIREGTFSDPPCESVRVFTVSVISVIIVILLNMFMFGLSDNTSTHSLRILGGVFGFMIIGSIHLIYVSSVEFAPDYLIGYVHTAFATAASLGYLLGSKPLHKIAQTFNSWFAAFFGVLFIAVVLFFVLTTNKDTPSTYHREAIMLKKYPIPGEEGQVSSTQSYSTSKPTSGSDTQPQSSEEEEAEEGDGGEGGEGGEEDS